MSGFDALRPPEQSVDALHLRRHVVLAPLLIWAGHTPVRQSDAVRLPSSGRYAIWGAEFFLLLLALWQAVLALRARPLAPLATNRILWKRDWEQVRPELSRPILPTLIWKRRSR